MTDVPLPPASYAEREFRVGEAMHKAMTVLSRNVLMFSVVTGIASLPGVFLFARNGDFVNSPAAWAWLAAGIAVGFVLSLLSQAVVLYAAFEDMRGRPVSLMASFQAAWSRILPVLGVAVSAGILIGLACLLLVVPGLILFTMWYVATPVCLVERIGPWKSMRRSAALTKGSRWKIFGMLIVLSIVGAIGGGVQAGLPAAAGTTAGLVVELIWDALLGAFSAILVVVTYHDLRVAKEGVDTDQIAAVFE